MSAVPQYRPARTSLPVIVIAGATSVGKSGVAMELCKSVNSEIIISDAVQVYSHLDIGSNKPTKADRELVPHHLLDVCHPSSVMTTGDYYRKASMSILDVLGRGKVPVVVGGSTMWVQWLVQGIPDAPVPSDEVTMQAEAMLKDCRTTEQWEEGLSVLRKYDAHKPDKLSKNDWYRLQRSLEIALQLNANPTVGSTTATAADGPLLQGSRTSLLPEDVDMRTIFITEGREMLYHTIDSRCVDMLELGHIQEVAELLLNDNLQPEYTVAKAIGYRQTITYLAQTALNNEIKPYTPEEETAAFVQYLNNFCTATRNYAKRQLNWYRKDNNFLFVRSRRHMLDNKAVADSITADEVQHWATVPRNVFDHAVKEQLAIADALAELRQRSKVPNDYNPDTHERRMALCWLICRGEVKIPTEEELNYVPPEPSTLSKSARKRAARLQNLSDKKVGLVKKRHEWESQKSVGGGSKSGLEDASIAALVEAGFTVPVADEAGSTAPVADEAACADINQAMVAPVVKREMPAWAVSIQDENKGITPALFKHWQSDLSATVPDVRYTSVKEQHKFYKNEMTLEEWDEVYQPLIEQAMDWRSRLLREKRDLLVRFLKEFTK